MLRRYSWLYAAMILTGCTAQPAVVAQPPAVIPHPDPYNYEHPPVRFTERVIPASRIGAAYRDDNLEHVLALGSPAVAAGELGDGYVERETYNAIREQVASLEQPKAINPIWLRYCDGGKDMTQADWQYVGEHNAPDGVPASLAKDCIYPK